MLLPERGFGIKRADSGYVMRGPAALPYLCPPLGCLSRIHMLSLDKDVGYGAANRLMSNPHAVNRVRICRA